MVDHDSASSPSGLGHSDVDRLRRVLTKMHLMGGARLVDRLVRRISIVNVGILRKFARIRILEPVVEPVLERLDHGDRLHFGPAELLRVCSALDGQQTTYWVTGGWGLDVLSGCETRRHSDLDLAIDGFQKNMARVGTVLTELGYQRKRPLTGTTWFPDAEVYEDAQGHHIEVHSIGWNVLRKAQELLTSTSASESRMFVDRDEATPGLLEKCTAEGTIQGVAIPTLSMAAQQLFHLGYENLRPEDSYADDLFRFLERGDVWVNPWSAGGTSVSTTHHTPSTLLLVPIFSFPPDLWRLCRIYHSELNLMPPHVALAKPFLPLTSVTLEVVRRLERLFSNVPAFDFELNRVGWFGTDVVYLEPSKSELFVSMVEAIESEFPGTHRSDDADEAKVFRLCLSERGSLADRRLLGRRAARHLPISARAEQVWLVTNERRADEWSIARIFPLAGPEDGATPALP